MVEDRGDLDESWQHIKDWAKLVLVLVLDALFLVIWARLQAFVEHNMRLLGLVDSIGNAEQIVFRLLFATVTISFVAIYVVQDVRIVFYKAKRNVMLEAELTRAAADRQAGRAEPEAGTIDQPVGGGRHENN